MKTGLTALVTALLLLCMACGADRGDPLGTEGSASVSPGLSRANLAVNEDNMYQAMADMFDILYDSFQNAHSTTLMANMPEKPVRIVGNYNGYAVINLISEDTSSTASCSSIELAIEYGNYFSDNGRLFITGPVNISVAWEGSTMKKFFVDGESEFSGDYTCKVEYNDLQIALNSVGKPLDLVAASRRGPSYSLPLQGNIRIINENSDSLWLNPYYFDRRGASETAH